MRPSPGFWDLIDETRPVGDDPEVHAGAVVARLVDGGRDATLSFARDFDRAMAGLYDWELWGAAYLALGGCSDDGFEYLRAWILGRGATVWELGTSDPESLFIGLLEETEDAGDLGERLDRGEHLLYAAGRAHETLTGEWLPPSDEAIGAPHGEAWEESDLPSRFPNLHRVAPSWDEPEVDDLSARLGVFQRVSDGLDAAATGDHTRAEEILRPVFEDENDWAMVSTVRDSRVAVAYALGIGSMIRGDVDGAAETFRRVERDISTDDALRRGLAQVELARGELDAAAHLLDPSPDADRFDRILTAKLLWRLGHADEAVERATQELVRHRLPDDHPWDVAGALLQAGHIFIDAELVDPARQAVRAMKPLLRGAPPDFALLAEWQLLDASVERLRGHFQRSLRRIAAVHKPTGYTLATWHRERARTLRAMSQEADAREEYSAAIEALEQAGEKWEAAVLREEGAG